jgi:hypothetical protein
MQLHGELFRVGKIPAHKAFVVVRGDLRLLYVSPRYRNYRYAAKKVFDKADKRFDIDHLLGSELTKTYGFQYTLLVRIDPAINRSHGWLERPRPLSGLNLSKFCYTDERVFGKITGVPSSRLPRQARGGGYLIVPPHARSLSTDDAAKVRYALGMGGKPVMPSALNPLPRKPSSHAQLT